MKLNTSKQVLRLLKFVSELNQNNYPNCSSFLHKLEQLAHQYDNGKDTSIDLRCSKRTLLRDIDALKHVFNAPLEYDSANQGYYLTRPWKFTFSQQDNEGLLTGALLGAMMADEIMPAPLNNQIREAVDEELQSNHSDFFDNAFMSSLIIASGVKADIDPETFRLIMDSWRDREVIEFCYQSPNKEPSVRRIAPHIICYHKNLWYVKGEKLPDGEPAVFAIHRISQVKPTGKFFNINRAMVEDVRKNGLFSFPKFDNIVLHGDAEVAFYFYEQEKAQKFRLTAQPDGGVLVRLPPSTEYDVIRWVLGESGKVQVLEPAWLKDKVVAAAEKIIASHTAS